MGCLLYTSRTLKNAKILVSVPYFSIKPLFSKKRIAGRIAFISLKNQHEPPANRLRIDRLIRFFERRFAQNFSKISDSEKCFRKKVPSFKNIFSGGQAVDNFVGHEDSKWNHNRLPTVRLFQHMRAQRIKIIKSQKKDSTHPACLSILRMSSGRGLLKELTSH